MRVQSCPLHGLWHVVLCRQKSSEKWMQLDSRLIGSPLSNLYTSYFTTRDIYYPFKFWVNMGHERKVSPNEVVSAVLWNTDLGFMVLTGKKVLVETQLARDKSHYLNWNTQNIWLQNWVAVERHGRETCLSSNRYSHCQEKSSGIKMRRSVVRNSADFRWSTRWQKGEVTWVNRIYNTSWIVYIVF